MESRDVSYGQCKIYIRKKKVYAESDYESPSLDLHHFYDRCPFLPPVTFSIRVKAQCEDSIACPRHVFWRFIFLFSPATLPPELSGPDHVVIRPNQISLYHFTVSDPGDVVTVSPGFGGDPPFPMATLIRPMGTTLGNYTLSMDVGSASLFNLTILVTDSGGEASTLSPLVVLCPCGNDQPCFPVDVPSNNAGGFVTATCNCSAGEVKDRCTLYNRN